MGCARIVLLALPLLACEQILDLDAYGPQPHGGIGGVGGAGGVGPTGGQGGSAGMPDLEPPTLVWHHIATGTGARWPGGSARAADGTFYLGGSVYGSLDSKAAIPGSDSYDAFLVKLDEEHIEEWSRVYASPSSQWVDDLEVDGEGNAVIGGWLDEAMDLDGTPIGHDTDDWVDTWIAKIAPDAAVLDTHRLYGGGDQYLGGLAYDNDLFFTAINWGVMNVAGEVEDAGGEPPSAVVARLESGPDWADQYSGDSEQVLNDVSTNATAVLSVGGSQAPISNVSTPQCDTNGGAYDVLVVVSPLDGGVSWSRCFGGVSDQMAWGGFARAEANEYLVVGTFDGELHFDGAATPLSATDQSDAFVAKLGEAGDGIWAVPLAGAGDQRASRVTEDSEGNIWVVGFTFGPMIVDGVTYDGYSAEDGFIVRLTQSGVVTWVGIVGGDGAQALLFVSPTPDGVLVSGTVSETFDLLGLRLVGDSELDVIMFELD